MMRRFTSSRALSRRPLLPVLALGVAGSAYTIRRISHRRYASLARRRATTIPFMVLLGILSVINVYLFLLPMAHRM